jgi:hypothetical protein
MNFQTNRIDFHRRFPELSLEAYVKTKQLDAFARIEGRKRIYLDTKYWVLLREAMLGRNKDREIHDLLDALRDVVQRGIAFCPICEGTLSEILSQENNETRRGTAALVDELGLGIGLLEHEMRSNTEIACMLHSDLPKERAYECDQLVWTSSSYALGYVFPENTEFDSKTMLCVQKAFTDFLWDLPLAKLLESPPRRRQPSMGFSSLAHRLNEANALHQHELTSFEQTFRIESHGAIDHALPIAQQVMISRYLRANGNAVPTDSESAQLESELRGFLFAVLYSSQAPQRMPTIHVNTSIHAFVRWNIGQQWEQNDFTDIRHAAAALGYCDAFFTERSLTGWLRHGELQLDKRYSCEVVYKVADALRVVREFSRFSA